MSPIVRRSAIAGLCGAAVLATGLGSAAAPDDQDGWVDNNSTATRACFQARRLDGFAAGEPNMVNLRAGKDVYQARFQSLCWTLEDATRISVQSRNGATDFICSGADAELVTYSPLSPPQHCVIKELRKLSLADVAALPGDQRP